MNVKGMLQHSVFLSDEAQTVFWGEKIGRALKRATVIYLCGDLGAGKTTLCRGLLKAFGYSGAVKSPTYTLVEPYTLNGKDIYHFDLYRLGHPEELEFMGIRDYFQQDTICLVEWPDRGAGYIAEQDLTIHLKVQQAGRTLEIIADSDYGMSVLSTIITALNSSDL